MTVRRSKPPPGSPRRVRPFSAPLAYAAVFAAGAILYAPSLGFELLNWDDQVYITGNPWIQGLTWEHLKQIFTHHYFLNYLPLHLLSYVLDYEIWGMKPFGFHAGSVLWNAVNGVLAVMAVRRLTGSLTIAFITGLLFAVHPSHVEAVAWVSIRKDLLSTTFLLLSVHAYLVAREGPALRLTPYVLSVLFFALGLLSKMSIVALPVFLVLVDLVRPGQSRNQKGPSWAQIVASKLPYVAVSVPLFLVNWQAQVKTKLPEAQGAWSYATVKGHAVWNYIGLLFGWRTGAPDYDLPKGALDPAHMLVELAGLAVLPALIWVAYRLRRPIECLGVGWVFVMLLPALAFPLVTYMADRYLYAPSLGFCLVVASLIVTATRAVRSAGQRRILTAALTAVPLVGFTYRTQQYLPVWKDSESLWTDALRKGQDYRAYNNLGAVRSEQKRWDEAERLYRLGTQTEQPNELSYRSLAVLYYTLGRYDEALGASDTALVLLRQIGWNPVEASELEFERGAIFEARGDRSSAIKSWEEALRWNAANANARYWLDQTRGTTAPRR